jgi:pyruvate dehydrogenase E1 component
MASEQYYSDIDPEETQEWLDAFASLVDKEGAERAKHILKALIEKARAASVPIPSLTTPYVNSISDDAEAHMPGDMFMERKVRSLIRWNALAMVLRANKSDDDLGGHIATFASSATLYDVGFNYFFRAPTENFGGDLIYIQGHSAPGIYARAFLEGRITESQLDNFRREVDGEGLSSYPHPWLMPDFWQFPTVSMGLGPLQAIYQAHIMKYLENRELQPESDRKVWAFLGDGEMDEPESLGGISLAVREKLDNLIFVINCNLQRLDGPVRGNGKIIQELEGVFRGAGWNVIKVIWGRHWDALFAKDKHGVLKKRMYEVVDGEYQAYKMHGGAYTRKHFFGKYPELLELVEDLSDEQIYNLNRGGHDPFKVYAAYAEAMKENGKPTVILAKTVKGYGLGAGESVNKTHQMKKMDVESLKAFRDRYDIPFKDDELESLPYYHPGEDSPEMRYMLGRRNALGGFLPQRREKSDSLSLASDDVFKSHFEGSGDREISTTMAFVRILSSLLKDKSLGERIVPIVPDEARTFGMEAMFRQLAIYSSEGQLYEPEDASQFMYYREDKKGQILEEGINEGGAFCAWLAAATSYSNNNYPMIPFYIYYSMFGFQRIGDFAWAAGDMQARGFLIGATSGRTTLNGEGLQHQDGHSHILASTIPNCVSYDATYAYELAIIIEEGMRRMYEQQESVFYYITTLNENYVHPALDKVSQEIREGIVKGMYLFKSSDVKNTSVKSTAANKLHVRLLGSGAIFREVEAAAIILENDYKVSVDTWSVTSFTELRREALDVQRWNRLHPLEKNKQSFVEQSLAKTGSPIVCATDYMKSYADQICPFVEDSFTALGTDGFGRSDSREKLRHFFEVDRKFIVLTALTALYEQGKIENTLLTKAIKHLEINVDKANPARS